VKKTTENPKLEALKSELNILSDSQSTNRVRKGAAGV
jgi:hypothetical protein